MPFKRYGNTLRDSRGRYAGSIGGTGRLRNAKRRKGNPTVNKGRSLVNDARKSNAIQNERKQIIDRLKPSQRKRLASLAMRRKDSPVSDDAKGLTRKADKATMEARKRIKTRLQAARDNQARLTGDASATPAKKKKGKAKSRNNNVDKRVPPGETHATVGNDGKLKVWDGTPHSEPKGGFTIKRDAKQDYGVEIDGQRLSLNNIKTVATYQGERVRGLAPVHHYDKNTPNERVVRELHQNMGYVESWDKKKVPAPAPFHDTRNGTVPDKYKPEKGYGQLQLHHVKQWYKDDMGQLQSDVSSGKVSLDTAKSIMKNNLRPNPNIKSGYEIKMADQKDREYVVLPAGMHDFNNGKKLYRANHPYGIHPETGELTEFGIPDKNKKSTHGETEGRQYHDGIRNGFWSEVRRNEVRSIQRELNTRLKDGRLSKDEFDKLWGNEVEKGRKKQQERLARQQANSVQ